MMVWITKYALSIGIFSEETTRDDHNNGVAVIRRIGTTWDQYYHGEGKEWHRTENEAIARAEAMRVAKIASLKKSIAKMEKLTFEAKP